jgi:F420-dependent oxidoreductase-like protein
MQVATSFGFFDGDPDKFARHARDLESAGVDLAWGGEIYGFDLATSLAFLAGQTERMHLMSGIFPVYSRTPTLIAQTAATIDALSQGRFVLGLGTSGPQVIEGWHGRPFSKPLATTRETVEVCRLVWSGERVTYDGDAIHLPLPADQGSGLGKPLKFMGRPYRQDIPIFIASIGPKNVEMTAELADGWQPIFFVPDRFREVWGESLDAGMAKRDPSLGPLQIVAGGPVAFGSPDDDHVKAAREGARANAGFYVGGMGARDKNFYNPICQRYGYVDEAIEIQDLYLDGKKDEAAAAVPGEMLEKTNLVGPAGYVKERLAAYQEAGVTHLSVNAVGKDPVATVEQLKELIG